MGLLTPSQRRHAFRFRHLKIDNSLVQKIDVSDADPVDKKTSQQDKRLVSAEDRKQQNRETDS